MIVYNTTFHAHKDESQRFVEWLRSDYVPAAVKDGRLTQPRLTLVLNAEASDGSNYSLQFYATDIDTLQQWYEQVGDGLLMRMTKIFGNSVAGFSTLLEEVAL